VRPVLRRFRCRLRQKLKAGKELATLIDIRRCVGCGACVEDCREANDFKYPDPKKPFPKMYPSRVKVADWLGENKALTRYDCVASHK
jgi:Fe-S-cluster-containing dehydrogenase component